MSAFYTLMMNAAVLTASATFVVVGCGSGNERVAHQRTALEEDEEEECVVVDEEDAEAPPSDPPEGTSEDDAVIHPTDVTRDPVKPPVKPPNTGKIPVICTPKKDAGPRPDTGTPDPCRRYKKGDPIPGTFTATRQDVVNRCIAEGGAEMCEGSTHWPCAGTHTHGTVTLPGGAVCPALRCDGALNAAVASCTRATLTVCGDNPRTSGVVYDPTYF